MLASKRRLTTPADYREVVRRGRRTGGPMMVLHFLAAGAAGGPAADRGGDGARIGFVVSKAVGPAVTRNLVKRRLRHLARERLTVLPVESRLVVRALPASALASYQELGVELDRCLNKVGVR